MPIRIYPAAAPLRKVELFLNHRRLGIERLQEAD
jgi:hypothetical protein